MEIWKDIEDYEGLYQVSNLGNVKSLNYHRENREQILKPLKDKDGYLQVSLYKNGKVKKYYIHRLVYEAFNGKIPEGYEINHLSEVKTENNLENLSLMSHKENINFGTRNNRIAKAKINGKLSKPVLQYDLSGNVIREWQSTNEVQRQTGYSHNNISYCCNGKYKTAYGFIWRYAS